MILDRRTALVVLETGSPTEASEVEPWLEAVYRDRRGYRLPWYKEPFRAGIAARLARERGAAWREDLASVAFDSPLQRVTQAQAHGIAERLGCEGYAAMLFGKPSILDAIDLLRAEGMERCLLLPIEPQAPDRGDAAADEFLKVWAMRGGDEAEVARVPDWNAEPEILDVLTMHYGETLTLARARDDDSTTVMFLGRDPGRSFVNDEVEDRIYADHERLAARLGVEELRQDAWLAPRHDEPGCAPLADEIIPLGARAGDRSVVILPTGWVADRFETLYDIDEKLARLAREHGMRTFRAPTVNDRSEFLDALAAVCARAASQGSKQDG